MELYGSIQSISGSMTASVFTGSFVGDGSGLYNIPASGVTGLNLSQISTGSVTASVSPSGFNINSDTSITGSLRVNGTIVAEQIDVTIYSSSVLYQSGSTRFGDSLDDNHDITGSVNITGSISLNGQPIGTGKLDETVFNAYTSSNNPRVLSLENFSASLNNFSTSINSFTTSLNSYTSSNNNRVSALEVSSGSLNSFTGSINNTIKNKLDSDGVISGSIQVNITGTTGYSTFSSSIAATDFLQEGRLGLLETSSGSLNVFSSSALFRLTNIETSTSSLNTFTSSTNTRLNNLENASWSIRFDFNDHTSSNNATNTAQNDRLSALEISTGSLNSYTSSTNTRLETIEVSTSSFNSFTSSINTTIKNRLNTEGVISGSGQIDITQTTNYTSFSSSLALTDLNQTNKITAIESTTASLNTFTSSANSKLNSLESTTGSLNSYTSSNNTRLGVIESTTASINTFTSSTNTRLDLIETSTGSLNIFTSSANTRFNTIETSTGSLNTFTSSANTRFNTIETSTSSLNTFTSSATARLNAIETSTSSLNSYTASNNTTVTNQNNRLTALESATSSLNSYTSSNNTRLDVIESTTASLNTYTSSNNTRLNAIETSTGSLNSFTSSINTTIKNRLNAEGVISGSVQVNLTSTTGYSTFSSSIASIDAAQDARLNSIEGKTGSYATTGSNIFQGNQIVTGSLFVSQDLIIAGSSSIQHISSSVVNIADNIITVNAQNPSIRFGGLAVIDSGSSPQVSGSMLFDSVNDQWIFVHQNQVQVTSSILLMGPQTVNNLGNETSPTTNRVLKSLNAEHVGDSNITDTGTKVSINSNTEVTGTFIATGTVYGTNIVAIETSTSSLNSYTASNNTTVTNQNNRLTALETSTGSLNTFSSSTNSRLVSIETSTSSLNTFSSSTNTRLGSLETTTGSLNTYTSSTNNRLNAIETSTSSLNTYTSSNNTRLTAIETSTSSLNSYTSSNNTRLGVIESTTSSLNTFTSSANSRLNALETSSGSVNSFTSSTSTRLSAIETATSSLNSYTASNNTTVTNQNNRLSAIETSTGSLNSFSSSTNTRLGLIETSTGSLNSFSSSTNTRLNSIETSTGSLNSFTSSINTTIKNRLNAENVISGSAQVVSALPAGTVSGSLQIDLTGTTNYISGIKTRLNAEGVLSGSAQVVAALPAGTVSGSAQLTSTFVQKAGDTMTGDLIIRNTSTFNNLRLYSNDDNTWVEQTKPDGTIVGRIGFDGYSSPTAYLTDFSLSTRGTSDSALTTRMTISVSNVLAFQNLSGFTYNGNNVWHAGNLTNLNQLTNGPGYLTSESDTLATVTARGNTTNGNINVNGNILMTGTATTTNQARTIDFTGFDKEGVTDFSDRAYIQHTTNTGGHAGSVLVISSENDADDGIAFLTNATSKLKHNSNNIATETWVTSQNYITSASVGNGTLTLAVSGTGLSGSSSFTANQSGNATFTVTSNATSANTASTIVARDSSGNFVAGRVTTGGLFGPGGSGNIPIWQYDSGNTGFGIVYNEGSPDTLRIDVSGQALSGTPDVLIGPDYIQVNGNTVYHTGNIPTWNQNTTGNAATATEVIRTVSASSEANLLYATIADNDFFRIRVGGASNGGFAEIATADDGNEPIHVRQYTGVFTSLTRTATLLDGSGNTSFPGTVTAPTFSGSLSGNASSVTNGVYTTGNQTIGGEKTFSSRSIFNGNILVSPVPASWAEGLSFTMPSTSTWGGLRWRRERAGNDGNWYIGFTALDSSDDLVFGANNGGSQVDNIMRMRKNGNIVFGSSASSTARVSVYSTVINSTVFDVQGVSGQLFSVTDDLTGQLFAVSDISGIPILDVNSNGVVTIDDTLNVFGDVTAYFSSDERLKDNVTPITNPIEKMKQIGGYEFDWNDLSKNEGHDVGVIAQEIEKVLPEVVTTRSDGFKAVKYDRLTALLIEANKELIKRVEELEKKIK